MKHITIFILSYALSLHTIGQELKDTQQLEQVIIRGQKPLFQQRPDGTVINVQGSILSKGSSVLQVLERSPGVVIDPRNNNLMLNGKSGVSVSVDGRLLRLPPEQVMAMLNNMSANNIATIELLTTPGARFDAEGNAGIINIITRKNTNSGTSGNLSLSMGHGWGEKITSTLAVTHNMKKVRLNGSYSISRDHTYSDLDIISSQNMPVYGGPLTTIFKDTTDRLQHNHEATAGVEVRADSSTTLGVSVLYNSSRADINAHTVASYDLTDDSLFFNGDISRNNRWKNIVTSAYLEKKLRRNSKLNAGFDHLYFDNNQPSEVFNTMYNKDGEPIDNNDTLFSPWQRGFANTAIRAGIWKMDYSRILSKRVQLETGVKFNYTRAQSSSYIQSLVNDVWLNRDETSTEIEMKEKIGAFYASLNIKPVETMNMVVGLRYEYADMEIRYPGTTLPALSRTRGVFFPNVLLAMKVNDASEWQLSYSNRISRPSYNDLASYASYSDPTAVYIGNPALQPAINHTVKLGYTYKGYNLALLAARDHHNIARYQITESPGRELLYISPVNIPRQDNLQLQVTAPVNLKQWWKMNYSVSGGWRKFRLQHTLEQVEKTYGFYTVNGSNTFLLPRGFSMELSGWYNSTLYNGSVKMKGFGTVNAGVKKELKNQAGTVQLSVTDIFKSTRINNYYGRIAREAFDIKNHVIYNAETTRFPVFRLTYTRTLGKGEATTIKRNPTPREETERIRKD